MVSQPFRSRYFYYAHQATQDKQGMLTNVFSENRHPVFS